MLLGFYGIMGCTMALMVFFTTAKEFKENDAITVLARAITAVLVGLFWPMCFVLGMIEITKHLGRVR